MEKKTFFQQMKDGTQIAVIRWLPDCDEKDIKGIIQISHGMVEHASRYERFAQYITQSGYIVSAHDHRGHGDTAVRAEQDGTGKRGFLADKNGFLTVVEDLREVLLKVKADYPDKEVILFAHSFGSFVGQAFIELYGGLIQKCILCGTAGPRHLLIYTGLAVTFIGKTLLGKKRTAHFINDAFFSSYNKHIQNPKSLHSWVSRDEEEVAKYDADPFCTFVPTAGFFYDLMTGLNFIHNKKRMKRIPQDLPVFLIAGNEDPVGSYAKTVRHLSQIYKNNGMTLIFLKVYPGARHELLNEINRKEVFNDIKTWINAT